MKKWTILLALTIAMSGCDQLHEKKSAKDILTEKLTLAEKEINDRIDDLSKNTKSLSDETVDDIEKTINQLLSEKKKVRELLEKTADSTGDELKKIEQEANQLKKELDDVVQDFLKKVEKFKSNPEE